MKIAVTFHRQRRPPGVLGVRCHAVKASGSAKGS
jgi:hypothetical protein